MALHWHCSGTSGTAVALQWHCSVSAVSLQLHCNDTAFFFKESGLIVDTEGVDNVKIRAEPK